MDKDRMILIGGLIVIFICCISIFSNIKSALADSRDMNLNIKYYKALKNCIPTKVYIESEDATKEILGKGETTCNVIEDGKKCSFPMGVTFKLSEVGVKYAKIFREEGVSNDELFDPDMTWSQEAYGRYCR